MTDDARVDLTFPEPDINDLLKSMVLEDFNGGRIAAVSYDSREPISRTLSSFAVNLNDNPTFAGIVSQMRGERVDVVLAPGAANQPGKLSGVIVGVEKQKVAANNGPATIDVEVLNMWCAEGLRTVKLPDIQQLKFANPVIESEFRRALDVLALSHDSQKKAVSLHFAGEGKRKVQVGYVIEAPIWKTSYRLVLGEKEKPYLQGWAMVENPTDEDWAGVKMALISGRPISFKMDLYNPLYVARPVVEPELFASLRPVTYRGGWAKDGKPFVAGNGSYEMGVPLLFGDNSGAHGARGSLGVAGGLPRGESVNEFYAAPQNAKMPAVNLARTAGAGTDAERKKHAADLGNELAQRLGTGTVGNAATAAALGDFFQYTIDHPVSLARRSRPCSRSSARMSKGRRSASTTSSSRRDTHCWASSSRTHRART